MHTHILGRMGPRFMHNMHVYANCDASGHTRTLTLTGDLLSYAPNGSLQFAAAAAATHLVDGGNGRARVMCGQCSAILSACNPSTDHTCSHKYIVSIVFVHILGIGTAIAFLRVDATIHVLVNSDRKNNHMYHI